MFLTITTLRGIMVSETMIYMIVLAILNAFVFQFGVDYHNLPQHE